MSSPGIPPVAYAAIVGAGIVLRWASWRGRANRIAERRAKAAEPVAARGRPGSAPHVVASRPPADAVPRQPVAEATLAGRPAAAQPIPQDAVDPAAFFQLADQVSRLVVDRQDASITMLKRELGISTQTAVRVLYELELRGIVGPLQSDPLLPRTVLVPRGR